MLVYPQTRKITRTAVVDRMIFLLVEAPAPNPGEQKLFWVTHTAATQFFESLIENGAKNPIPFSKKETGSF